MIDNTILITILCSALMVLYLGTKRKVKEDFTLHRRSVQQSPNSADIIQIVKDRLCLIFDKKYKFSGVLSVLNQRNVLKEIKIDEGSKSFTINKKDVFLCLKDKQGKYYDINSLMYVALHEMAHVVCAEKNHTALFAKIFKSILQHASNIGLYDSTKPFVKNYCPS